MIRIHTFILALALGSAAAAETADEAAFLDFISPDPKATRPAVAPEIKTPSEANAMLEKWKSYELSKSTKLKNDMQAARNLAVEMLLKKSLSATPEARATLVAEAERIKALTPDKALLPTGGAPIAKLKDLAGRWDIKNLNAYHVFNPDGTGVDHYGKDNARFTWKWIDSEAGVFVLGKPDGYGNVYWVQKANHLMVISSTYFRGTMDKVPSVATLSFDPITVNLTTSEDTQLRTFKEALNSQRQRVVQWLLSKAKAMAGSETAEVVRNVMKLENESADKDENLSKLSGLWRWEKMELRFLADGIIAQRDGRKVGRWGWLNPAQQKFVVVLNGGKTADNIFLVDTPRPEDNSSIPAHRLNAGHIFVSRTPL